MNTIPSVDSILMNPILRNLLNSFPRPFVLKAVRRFTEKCRSDILGGKTAEYNFSDCELLSEISSELSSFFEKRMKRVVNATGIILHTGMGRAPFADSVIRALEDMSGFVNIQADLEHGKRSRRDGFAQELLCELTGAEAALVVNNNAAATMLVLNTFAYGKEAIVSRGQLVEIGGSFRLPDVMDKSGVMMKEVGTTNRTHLADYENAVSDNTSLIFRVHPSNYRISGFVHQPSLPQICGLARKKGLIVADDIGAGSLLSFSEFGISDEPLVGDSIAAGADLVLFSGDKLLGGPQAGIILGRKSLIEKIRKNPLSRILRVCKLTISVLDATLMLYFDKKRLLSESPFYRALSFSSEELRMRAESIAGALSAVHPDFKFTVEKDFSYMGSGSMPMDAIESYVVSVKSFHTPDKLAALLRKYQVPIFSRISNDRVIFDMRTLLTGEERFIIEAFESIKK